MYNPNIDSTIDSNVENYKYIDCSFVDISFVDISYVDCYIDSIDSIDSNKSGLQYGIQYDNQTEIPISIKINPQIVIPVHDCEVIYYEPRTRRRANNLSTSQTRDQSASIYKILTTIVGCFICMFLITSITYTPF